MRHYFLFFLLLTLNAQATETIVVTATRLEQNESATSSAHSSLQLGSAPTENNLQLADSLQGLPGVQLRMSGGPGQSRSLFLRGANAEHSLVLLDGIPLNDPLSANRSYDFAHLDPGGWERVEIIRGPQSGVYGSDAMSGVVQIFTPEPQMGPVQVQLNAEAGSHDTHAVRYQISKRTRDTSVNASAHHVDSLGISAAGEKYGNYEADGFNRDGVSLQVGHNFSEHTSAKITAHTFRSVTELDTAGGKDGDSPKYETTAHSTLARAELSHWWDGDSVKTQAGFSTNQSRRDYLNPDFRYHSHLYKADLINHWSVNDKQTLSAGGDWQQESGDSTEILQNKSESQAGAFVQYTGDSAVLFGSANLRQDWFQRFGEKQSVRFAPGIHILYGTDLFGSYGTGFKAPSLYQSYSQYGSLSLRPEKTHAWDAGIRHYLGNSRHKFEVQYFEQRFQDLLTTSIVATAPVTYRYVNISNAETKGIEASLSMAPTERLDTQFSFTKLSTKDLATGLQLLRRPKYAWSILVNLRLTDTLLLSYKQLYTGARDDLDPSSFLRKRMPSYLVRDLGARWDFLPSYSLNARVENMFDKDYEDVAGYGTLGRSIYAGLTAQF